MSDFDQRRQKVDKQVNAENINFSNIFFGDNNTVVNNLGDIYKPYLVGLIDKLEKDSYVTLSGYTTEIPEQYKDLAHGQSEVVENYRNIFDVLKKHSKFVLLGDPGSGKSQVLRFMVLQVAQKCLETNFQTPLPLLIDLSSWDGESDFENFIKGYWKNRLSFTSDPMPLIAQGAVLLFLDGLNEMGESGIENVEKINNWISSSQLLNKKIFIACRKSDYLNKELKLEILDFPKVFILPLTDEQIIQFVNTYLEMPQEFLDQYIGEEPQEYLRLPYTLHRLTLLSKMSEKYIKNPGALNHILVKSLWRREIKKGTLKNTKEGNEDENMVFAMLEHLALRLFGGNETLSFDKEFALETFSTVIAFINKQDQSVIPENDYIQFAKDVLEDAFQLGLLVSDTTKIKFNHQLLFEYFVARVLWNAYKRGKDLPFEEVRYDEENVFKTFDFKNLYFADSIMESIFIQVFGIQATIGEELLEIFIYNLLKRSNNPFLAVDCINKTGVRISPAINHIIVYELLQKYLFFLFGQPKENSNPLMDVNALRSIFKSASIEMGVFPVMAKDFAIYISKVLDDSSIETLTNMIGEEPLLDYGIMLGLVLSGEAGQNFFVNFLNDEGNDYGIRSRIAKCIFEFPPEKKYIKTLQKLSKNKTHTFGRKGMIGGRYTIGEIANQKLQEIESNFS